MVTTDFNIIEKITADMTENFKDWELGNDKVINWVKGISIIKRDEYEFTVRVKDVDGWDDNYSMTKKEAKEFLKFIPIFKKNKVAEALERKEVPKKPEKPKKKVKKLKLIHKIGDTVELNSGSPAMVISDISGTSGYCECQWYDTEERFTKHEEYPQECLRVVK
ncbi:MAG TPA: DUF2158 domain-containing protein [bacterium]|nr:DUF2158 domain-containing protein [bacterium]